VIRGSVGDQLVALALKLISKDGSVRFYLFNVILELGTLSLFKLSCESSNLVVVRATLEHGEHSKIHLVHEFFFGEDHSRSRTSKSLVSGRSNNIGILEGIIGFSGSDKTADVSHVSMEIGANTVANLSKPFEIKVTRICREPSDNEFGTEILCCKLKGVIVNETRFNVNVVLPAFEE
jgi:hypothetical protein